MAICSPDIYINVVSTTTIMRSRAQDIVNRFAVTTRDFRGRPSQDEEQSYDQAMAAVQMIIDLPVCWIDKDLQQLNPDTYEIEGTLEYWEEMLNELKIMQ